MKLLEGFPISPGCARGIAVVYDFDIERRLALPHRSISHLEVDSECTRVNDALEQSREDLKLVERSGVIEPKLVESARLMSAHSAMAKDIAALVRQHIGRELVNAEQALDAVIHEFVARFERHDNIYFREREQDVRDVARRLSRHLADAPLWTNQPLPPGSVIVACELLPSETVELARSGVVAIVCEHGGEFSHVAIVARSLGIPAIAGISNVTSQISPGMSLLVDGEAGTVVAAPSQSDEEVFERRKRERESLATSMATTEKLPCVTRDGVEISLLANIGLPEEVAGVAEHNLDGAGLFRTEFLFLESRERPTCQVQKEIYASIAKGLGDVPLVIRTFDLGGDKLPPFLQSEGSKTLASLHLRGLRFSLSEWSLLETQLRAILHVAQTADVRILFPMVIGSDDFARAIAVVDEVAGELGLLGRPLIGAMIETPAALYALDEIIELADFVAIGTNDLSQYMLAADRDLADATDDCTAMHPAVLRAIRHIVEVAERQQCPVCVCGEEAGEANFAYLLIGLGIRELSLTPTRAAAVRHALRHIACNDARKVAELALQCRTPQQVRELPQSLPSTGAIAPQWENGMPCEPATRTLRQTPVVTQSRGPARDRRQSVRGMQGALERRVAEGNKHLSQANRDLAAAAQDARLSAVAFNTHDSIVITDQDGKILRVNTSFTKLTGYTSDDVIGKTPRILRSGRHGEEFYREMWQTIHTKGHWQGEIWNKRKDGHVYLQRLTIACVKNESGETTHYVGDGQDLTQQKQGESDRAAMRAAWRVQQTLLPTESPRLPGFDIAGAVHPAERVSGDFFDYIPWGPGSLGVVMADVSGHGMGPALLMAQTQAYLRALAELCEDPGELLTRANRLFTSSGSGHFVTMFLGRLNTVTRSLLYAGAGHQGYLVNGNGAVQVLNSTSLPLGVEESAAISSAPAVFLNPGDTLVVPTDGTEEAMSPVGRAFGRERMLDVVRNGRTKSATQIVDDLFSATRKFAENRPQLDDISAIVVKVLPVVSADMSAELGVN